MEPINQQSRENIEITSTEAARGYIKIYEEQLERTIEEIAKHDKKSIWITLVVCLFFFAIGVIIGSLNDPTNKYLMGFILAGITFFLLVVGGLDSQERGELIGRKEKYIELIKTWKMIGGL